MMSDITMDSDEMKRRSFCSSFKGMAKNDESIQVHNGIKDINAAIKKMIALIPDNEQNEALIQKLKNQDIGWWEWIWNDNKYWEKE
jgi:hypothetical protein